MIHAARRRRRGWLFPTIFASAWLRRWCWAGCRATGGRAFQSERSECGSLGDAVPNHGRDFAGASGGDRRSGRIEAHHDYLLGLVRRSPDLTLLEIQERLIANCGERFAFSVLWRFFDRHEITFKKSRRMPRSNNARTCIKRRREWFAGQLDLDPTKLVFIDESVLQSSGRSST